MRSEFDKSAISADVPGIVLLSHGGLSLGMLDTIRTVMGPTNNISAFTLEEDDDPELYSQAFREAIDAYPSGAIVFVDMFGGSPCNQLLLHAQQIQNRMCAFSGMNFPMISEAIDLRDCSDFESLREHLACIVPNCIMDLCAVMDSMAEED